MRRILFWSLLAIVLNHFDRPDPHVQRAVIPLAIALLISAAAGAGSAALGSSASNKAATTQANAETEAAKIAAQSNKEALNFQKQQYNNSMQLAQPYFNFSNSAMYRLSDLMGLPRNFTALPQVSTDDSSQSGPDQPSSVKMRGPNGNIVDVPNPQQVNFLLQQGYQTINQAPTANKGGMPNWDEIANRYKMTKVTPNA